MNGLQTVMVYSLAFIGIMALTIVAVIGFALWYHNRTQVRLLRDATKFLEVVERTSHGTINSKPQTERVGHA